jgi:hypothetical protein
MPGAPPALLFEAHPAKALVNRVMNANNRTALPFPMSENVHRSAIKIQLLAQWRLTRCLTLPYRIHGAVIVTSFVRRGAFWRIAPTSVNLSY